MPKFAKIKIAALALLALACNGLAADITATPASAPLRITVAPAKEKVFPFGKIVDANFTLTNTSDRALVVLDVGKRVHLAARSTTLKDEQRDAYRENPFAQMHGGPSLQSGFLLPGERLEINRSWRPEERHENPVIRFAIAREPYRHTPQSLLPLNVYIADPDNLWTFIPFTADTWRKVLSSGRLESIRDGKPVRGTVPDRRVLVPNVGSQEAPIQTCTIPLAISFDQPGFERHDAEAAVIRIVGSARPIEYSDALGGYLVFENDHTWTLRSATQRDTGTHLALCPPSLPFSADVVGTLRLKIADAPAADMPPRLPTPPGTLFWNRYPITDGIGYGEQGARFITVHLENLEGFLTQTAAERHMIQNLDSFSSSLVLRPANIKP